MRQRTAPFSPPRSSGLRGCEQNRTFQQAAEFLLGDLVVLPLFGRKILHHLVRHAQSLQVDDADVLVALLPDLILL